MKEFGIDYEEAINFPFCMALDSIFFSEKYAEAKLLDLRTFLNADAEQLKEILYKREGVRNPKFKEEYEKSKNKEALALLAPGLMDEFELRENLAKKFKLDKDK